MAWCKHKGPKFQKLSVYDSKRTTKCKALNDKADRKPNLAKKARTSNVAPEYTL